MRALVYGLDVHKESTYTTILDPDGEIVTQKRIPNSEHQLRGFTADLIIANEAAFFHNDNAIFDSILPPMLATTDGTLIVSSTP